MIASNPTVSKTRPVRRADSASVKALCQYLSIIISGIASSLNSGSDKLLVNADQMRYKAVDSKGESADLILCGLENIY